MKEHSLRPNNVGFVFGGDANCMWAPWAAAVYEERTYRLHFEEPNFVYANEDITANRTKAKDGDIAKGKRDHLIRPIAWQELSWEQKWYVRQFRNGNLWEAKKTTESQYHPHSAETNRFRMD